MSNFSSLKTAIANAIKQNGNQEITGNLLQGILLSIVETLGDSAINTLETGLSNEATTRGNADTNLNNLITGVKNNVDNGYVYAGIAIPTTSPVSGKVFYIATKAGTYTNLGGLSVTEGITILKYNGSTWSKEQVIYGDGGVYDVTAQNGGTTFASLEALLGSGSLSTLIPTAVRKGGMSIKFVQSSDHKYVQYRYMSDDASTVATFTNTDNWSFCGNSVYVENPEFAEVKMDDEDRILEAIMKDGTKLLSAGVKVIGTAEYDGATIKTVENPEFAGVWLDGGDKILFGVENDGNFLFGCGVPKQVKEYIEQKIEELSLDEYESIVTFIGDYLNNTTLEELLSKKVDGEYVENSEFIEAKIDAEDKVLEGIQKDGTKVIGGDLKVLGNMELSGVTYKIIENPEYIAAWVDAEDKIVFGLKTDGKTYVSDADFLDNIEEIKNIIDNVIGYTDVDWEAVKAVKAVEEHEYIDIETDAEGRILGGRKPDGTKFENIALEIGGNVINSTEDPENRTEITTDYEEKIVSYRDKNGVLHENAGINTSAVNIEGVDILPYLRNDIVNDKPVYVEKPKFAELKFYGSLPTDRSETRRPTVLVLDYCVSGHTVFRTNCMLSIQGHGSATLPKKGYTLDFVVFSELNQEDWNADDVYYQKNSDGTYTAISAGTPYYYGMYEASELDVKFGNMPAVDSYHLKAYYTDKTHTRGVSLAAIWRDMLNCLPAPYNKVNNKPLDVSDSLKDDDIFVSDARYREDGFPCAFYLNDEFWGLYTLKLKKNRKNYAMDKSNKNEIFLDSLGIDENPNFPAYLDQPFEHSDWEVKNPKLKNYDAGGEIPDATVLSNIERLFNFLSGIDVNDPTTYEDYADYIVLPHWLLYYIHSELLGNIDINGNNMEVLTWDATHWTLIPYDMDCTVGLNPWNNTISATQTGLLNGSITVFAKLKQIFETELKNLYTSMRKSGMIEVENLYKYFISQSECIPRSVYSQDRKKWENPWENGYPNIEQIYFYINSRIEYLDSIWLVQD